MNPEDEREAKRRTRISGSLDGRKKLLAKNINARQAPPAPCAFAKRGPLIVVARLLAGPHSLRLDHG